ncbi:MAG: phosphate uptake regulator PhoU [Euryarchaeota archaeon]|nr:phosphate uptake regulator PhoU [Euryarchaeota archaeon]
MLRRKVYSSGSSPMLSLPRDWVEAHGLRDGYVLLDVQENCIVIEPEESSGRHREFVIDSSRMDVGELHRRVIAAYLAGYSTIRIRFNRDSIRLKEKTKDLLNFLIAVEVIKDLGYEITAQVLLSHAKLPVLKVVERVSGIVEGMLQDLSSGISSGDCELLRHVTERELEVDRLYFLAVRQLKSAAMSQIAARQVGIEHRRDVLGIRLIVKSLERIADHVESIATKLIQLSVPEDSKLLLGVAEGVSDIYLTAKEATLSFDADLAEEVFRKLPAVEEEMRKSARELVRSGSDLEEVITLRLSLESYYRIARYCCDVGEIIINMHAEVPERGRQG